MLRRIALQVSRSRGVDRCPAFGAGLYAVRLSGSSGCLVWLLLEAMRTEWKAMSTEKRYETALRAVVQKANDQKALMDHLETTAEGVTQADWERWGA